MLNQLPDENENPLSFCAVVANIFLAPIGLVGVVLQIPLILLLEILFVTLCPLVLFLLFMANLCCGCPVERCGIFSRLDVTLTLALTSLMFIPYGIILLIEQTLRLIIVASDFLVDILCCKRRWQDAPPHILKRAVTDTLESIFVIN